MTEMSAPQRPSRRRPSLRVMLALYVALPASLWVAAVVLFVIDRQGRELERSLQEDVELVGRAIRHPLTRALEHGNLQEVTSTLLSTLDIGRVYGVSVYDIDGRLIAAEGDIDPDSVEQPPSADMVGAGDARTYERLGGRRVYSYFLPLNDSIGRMIGLLHITRRQREMDEALASRRHAALAVALGGAAGFAVLALMGHHRGLQRYLDRLAEDMVRIRRGEREHRSSTDGPAEIHALAVTFNEMLESIALAEREIEQRRRTEAALADDLRRAEKLAALGRLSAGIAHELGSPLSVIDGHAQRMLRRADCDPRDRDALLRIRSGVARTERLVRHLMEVGRSRGREALPSSPAELIQTALAQIREEFAQGNLRLEAEVIADLPVLRMDSGRIELALLNLLRNACQAAGTDGHVRLGCRLTQTWLEIAVEDDGPGVDEALRQRIFEPFFTTKPVGSGTGLGLAVVQSVVEEHRGELEVTDSVLGGSRFVLRLPREAT